jgi:aminopeptidase N
MNITAVVMAAVLAVGPERAPDPLLPEIGGNGYDVRAYDLSFDFNPASRLIDGTASITADTTKPLAKFDLDHAGGTVRSVVVDGRPAAFTVEGQKLRVVPAGEVRRGRFRLTVRYTADRDAKVPSRVDNSAGWGNNADGGFAWWPQPDRAHVLFPCNDDVADKADFTYRVTVPDGWTAVAGGRLVSQRSAGGRTTFVHRTAHPTAPQLTQLAVGKFDVVTGTGPHGLPLRSAVPAGTEAPGLDRLPEHLTWLEHKIGRRYPFEVAGVLGVAGTSPEQTFALETQTLPIVPASELSDPAVVVHELAHQWFGASAGASTWNDVWLSEGFATYLHLLWSAEHGGTRVDEVMRQTYGGDQQMRTAGIKPGAPGSPEVMFGVGRSLGALVVYALQEKAGEATFQRIVQTYLDRYRDGAASSADFVAITRAVGGQELAGHLHDWLYGATTPPMAGHPDW